MRNILRALIRLLFNLIARVEVSGYEHLPKEGNFVIADPPMATIQVFDKDTGEYLYHYGNEKAEVEAESKQRALWDVSNPAGISIDKENNNLWICMPRTGSAMVRQMMD